jgi:hypothetical protein
MFSCTPSTTSSLPSTTGDTLSPTYYAPSSEFHLAGEPLFPNFFCPSDLDHRLQIRTPSWNGTGLWKHATSQPISNPRQHQSNLVKLVLNFEFQLSVLVPIL